MIFLSNLCRICVQTGVKLVNIHSLDVDSVALSEKLETCTKMVISIESISNEICMECIKKLRICYEFYGMCKQSTKILEGYLNELRSVSEKNIPEHFNNSEIRVTLTPLCKNKILQYKRKRITKEARCSLLKKLLSTNERIIESEKYYNENTVINPHLNCKSNLQDIINFTRNYNFRYGIDKNHNFEATPLDKLKAFSNNFFKKHRTNFNETILQIIDSENILNDSDDEDMFDKIVEEEEYSEEELRTPIKIEEVVIEPDIKIKEEIDDECSDEYPVNFVETSYDLEIVKKENVETSIDPLHQDWVIPNNITDIVNNVNRSFRVPVNNSSSVNLLDNFVESFGVSGKTFSRHSVRCRTRDSPYINPHLRQQFQHRCFKCSKCNRYFKSPGYLKAHITKVH